MKTLTVTITDAMFAEIGISPKGDETLGERSLPWPEGVRYPTISTT